MFIDKDMGLLLKIIGNIIFTSIPEELFIVTMSLILLRIFNERYDIALVRAREEHGYTEYINIFSRIDIIKIFFCTVLSAVVSNALRYTGFNINVVLLVSGAFLYLLILVTFKFYYTCFDVIKAFFSVISSIFILIAIEYSYVPIILYVTNKSISFLNGNLFLNFLFALPERIIEYSILAFMLMKRASFSKARLVKAIFSSKLLTALAIGTTVANLTILLILGKLIVIDKILFNLSVMLQILIIVSIFVWPIINIAILAITLFYFLNRTEYNKYMIMENIDVTLYDLKFFASKGNNCKIITIIDTLEKDLNGFDTIR